MPKRIYGGVTYSGGRGRRSFRPPGRTYQRRRGPSLTALRRAGIVIPAVARGYQRTGGFYGRYSNGGETKFHDIDVDVATVLTAGSVLNSGTINIIPQGVLENNRVGRKCTIKKIFWKYNVLLKNSAAESTTTDTVRLILFVDKQCNGATATVADILASANYQSFRALENVGRFVILMDRTITINSEGLSGVTGSVQSSARVMNGKFAKSCNIPIEYDNSASTGVLTTIRTNNLSVLAISANALSALDSKFRLRFTDA